MAYYFYLGNVLLPIPPKKLELKISNQNKTYDYEIEDVSDDYYMDNNINYKMLTIKGDYKTEDKIINLKFIKGKTQILMQIIKMIKGGIV